VEGDKMKKYKKKYKLTKVTKQLYGITLFQIEALISFGNVSKGDKGGFIEKKEFSISKCCNASVHTNMSPDFIGDNPKTQKIGTCYYICDACGEPCDLAEWNKEPKSKDRIGE
jgi:hypothetical protein